MTTLALAEPFIASDAAAAFCFFSAEGKEKLSPPSAAISEQINPPKNNYQYSIYKKSASTSSRGGHAQRLKSQFI